MGSKIDRTGEKNINSFGSEIVIVGYRGWNDIDVYFSEYDWMAKNRQYIDFKNGQIKCPYERRYYNVGYLGEGKYRINENGKHTRVYNTWHSMLQRCYDEKHRDKNPTYKDCKVSEEWHNFQNFAEWYEKNYYKVGNKRMHLDKDILCKHNKIYSTKTCVFVPQIINNLFVKRQNDRGISLIGTSLENGKYRARCHMVNPKTGKLKKERLGLYDTELEAFGVYKYYKEKNIKEVADYFKKEIPGELYNAMYNYIVEITD